MNRYFRLLQLALSILAPMLFSVSASGQGGWVKLASDTSRLYYDVSFANEQKGVITGILSNGSSLAIRTTDGGKSWQQILFPPNVDSTWSLSEVRFFDEQRGYIVGGKRGKQGTTEPDRSLVLSTSDGGASWQRVSLDSNLSNAVYSDVSFPTSQVGYLAGANSASTAIMAKTTDGGTTWQRITGPVSNGNYYNFYEIEFRDLNNGMVTAGKFEPVQTFVWITSDGGITWKQPESIFWSEGNSNRVLRNLTYVTDRTWILFTSRGLARTTNDGATWDSVYTPLGVSVMSIAFAASTQIGYAVGDIAKVLKTIDGGATWDIQQSNHGHYMFDVSAPSESVAYAVGFEGIIIKNSGTTSIKESNQKSDVRVYPNPATGDITVETPYLQSDITLTNSLGQVVYHTKANENKTYINTSALSPGIYVLKHSAGAQMISVVR